MAAVLIVGSGMALPQHALHEPEERVIRYEASDDLADPVSILQKRIASGKANLRFEPDHGYLVSLLALLHVPISSQGLVFSKTSLQTERVSPRTPRAVYFKDDVYVSWVPGGDVIDVSAVDPNKGPVFYTLAQRQASSPVFTRSDSCMSCHLGPKTVGVPGYLLRSVVPAADGYPLIQVDRFLNGHESPLEHRWGGWYVTGTLAADAHMGNSFFVDRDHTTKMDLTEPNISNQLVPLEHSRYLSRHSDVVALMVLAHQVKMQNLITRANYEARYALDPQMAAQSPEWAKRRIANAAEPLLEYMLFRDEAVLHGPVRGSSTFTEDFERDGLRDSKGRSLRELDLKTKLLRYPCSFLIYSEAFDAIPSLMKNYLWQRLFEILRGKDQSRPYATMSRDDRQAVFDILRETKPEFTRWLKNPLASPAGS